MAYKPNKMSLSSTRQVCCSMPKHLSLHLWPCHKSTARTLQSYDHGNQWASIICNPNARRRQKKMALISHIMHTNHVPIAQQMAYKTDAKIVCKLETQHSPTREQTTVSSKMVSKLPSSLASVEQWILEMPQISHSRANVAKIHATNQWHKEAKNSCEFWQNFDSITA